MSTEVDTQNPSERADEVTAEPGSADEAINLFNQQAQSKAQTAPETPEDELPATESEEPEEGEPEEAEEPAETFVEVEYEGKTLKVPPEAKDALLRQSDYSRKLNELGETKKDYAQRIESATKLAESAEKLAEAIAEVKLIDRQLEQFKTIDFEKLETEDPARASLLALKQLQLQRARDNSVSKANSLDSEIAEGRAKDIQAKQAEMIKVLQKDFPGWGDEAGAKVTQYALKSGYTADELRQFTDPRLVLVLEKARKFDAIQDGKQAALAKVKDAPPVAKPGAPRKASPSNDAMARFQKSMSPDDAVAVFQARAAGRR